MWIVAFVMVHRTGNARALQVCNQARLPPASVPARGQAWRILPEIKHCNIASHSFDIRSPRGVSDRRVFF